MYEILEEKIDKINAKLASDIDTYRQVVTEEIRERTERDRHHDPQIEFGFLVSPPARGWDCHYDPQTGLLQGARKLIDCDLEGYWIDINFSRFKMFGRGPVSIFSQEGTYPWLNYHDAINVVDEVRDIVDRASSRRRDAVNATFKD